MGVRYGSVVKVIGRYRDFRRENDGDANSDGMSELKETFDQLGVERWSTTIGNGHRDLDRAGSTDQSGGHPPRRDSATHGIHSAVDLRNAATNGTLEQIKDVWRAVPGQNPVLAGVTCSCWLERPA